MHCVEWYVLIAALPHIYLEELKKTTKCLRVIAPEREVSRYKLPGLGGLKGAQGPNILHMFLSLIVFAGCANERLQTKPKSLCE
jgi:hypothetical protein